MTETLHKKRPIKDISDEFAKVAFAESGELYSSRAPEVEALEDIIADASKGLSPEAAAPHGLEDTLTEVAFAEAGEPYTGRKPLEEKKPPVCVKGETPSGLCT